MIREAELFIAADDAATRVFGSVRDDEWDVLLPPVFDMAGADQPTPLRQAARHYAYDNAWVPDMLAGRTMDEVGRDAYDGDLLGDDPAVALRSISAVARTAARAADDRDAVVHCGYGDVPAHDYLWQLNIARCLSALDIAALLGLPNPISEELARGMVEGTEPTADMWRSFGVYRERVAVADGAPWRDRYLTLTGRQPWKGPTDGRTDS